MPRVFQKGCPPADFEAGDVRKGSLKTLSVYFKCFAEPRVATILAKILRLKIFPDAAGVSENLVAPRFWSKRG